VHAPGRAAQRAQGPTARSDGGAKDLRPYTFLYAYMAESGPLYAAAIENGMDMGETEL
jgi:hypothetical protein